MEANSSYLIPRNFTCVGYKESEEHIFKTMTSRKPFPLQNHRSLKEILASFRPESLKQLAASLFSVYFTIYCTQQVVWPYGSSFRL